MFSPWQPLHHRPGEFFGALTAQGGMPAGVRPPRPPGVRRFVCSAMDSGDEEALAALLQEEADADVQDEEHFIVLVALAGLLASNEKPRRGGSAPGGRKRRTGIVWKATACSTLTTSPTLHCSATKYFGAVIG